MSRNEDLMREQQVLERLDRLAKFLDSSLKLPGTKVTLGLDSVLGVLPLGGDLAGMLISSYFILVGYRLGASRATLKKMAANIVIDALVGSVPVLGDIFDVSWKANIRNVKLLKGEVERIRLQKMPA